MACKISVIVPMFNAAGTIERCIDSVLTQSFQAVDLCVIDDCSTDHGAELVLRRAAQDPRVRYVRNERNLMLGGARNVGLRHCLSPYVFFLDADDYLLPGCFDVLVDQALKTDADVVQGGSLRLRSNGMVSPYHGCDFETLGPQQAVEQFAQHRLASVVWNKLYKRGFLCGDAPTLFNEHMMHEDVPFTLEVACRAQRIISISQPVICYVESAGSLTNKPATTYNLESYLAVYFCLIESFQRHQVHAWPQGVALMRQVLKAHASGDIGHRLQSWRKAMGPDVFEQAVCQVCERRLGVPGLALADMVCGLLALPTNPKAKSRRSADGLRKLLNRLGSFVLVVGLMWVAVTLGVLDRTR